MLILVTVEMLTGAFLADFCAPGPLSILKDIVKDKTFNYFTTCEGGPSNGPAYEEIRSGISLAKQLLSQTKALEDSNVCTGLSAVFGPGGVAPATTTLRENVEEVISCKDSINPLLVSLTQQYMCTNTVNGLYDLWAVQVAGSVMLYLILILTEFVRPYIGAKAKPANGQPAYVGQPVSHGQVEGKLNYDV